MPPKNQPTLRWLLHFLRWAAGQPGLNPTTVQAMRSAWNTVANTLGLQPGTDVSSLQLDELMDEFELKRGPNFRSGPTYRTRLRVGQQLFLAWSANDPTWTDIARTKQPTKPRGLNIYLDGQEAAVMRDFPLRRDLSIALELPNDLTSAEAERICAFVRSHVIESSETSDD
jgi:hypothetical protein